MKIHPTINRTLLAALIRGTTLLTISTVCTAPASAGTPKIVEKAYRTAYDVIQSVNPTAQTVTIATMVKYVDSNAQALAKANAPTPKASAPPTVEKTRTLAVTKFTEIIVNGKPGELSALQPSMKVDVTVATNEANAGRIVATD